MTSKEIISREIEEIKETLKRAEKYGFQELAEQCKEDIKKYNQVLKDLELLEKYKKVMYEPIVELMKDLEKLELYEKVFPKMQEDGAYYKGQYYKQQEILEILKNGQVNIHFDLVVKDTFEEYLAGVEGSKVILTEKEWNELKEWLKNEE